MLCGFGAAVCVAARGAVATGVRCGGVSVFWLLIVIGDFFYDGGFALIGPYMAEVWPTRLRATGMGSAYGFGGIGKIIGPLGLALIVGTSNVIEPKATLAAVTPSFLYFAAWLVLCGMAFALFGFETGRRSIAAIDDELVEDAPRGSAASPRRYANERYRLHPTRPRPGAAADRGAATRSSSGANCRNTWWRR